MSLGRVDRYELLEAIGQGSFGGVYRARHIHTGQVHALKLARDTADPDGMARVLVEARATATLRHPNVVSVIDGGVTASGEAFIVMELLQGSTLAQIIAKEGPLPPARAVRIARQMLEGLSVAHAHGIIHRDVKPTNVFVTTASDVTGGDMVKVIDFGISKMRPLPGAEGSMTLPGMAMGTPGYMAPEQLGDARSVDPRADVYAVGATLFEMLTKRVPIEGVTFETWMQRMMTERAPPLATIAPHVPPALAMVVDRALSRDVDARWPSAMAMREALDAAFAVPHEGFSLAAMDTPRAVVHAIPATSNWPLAVTAASGPPHMSSGAPGPMPMAMAPMVHPPHALRGDERSRAPLIIGLVVALVIVVGLVVVVGAGAVLYVTRRTATASPAVSSAAAPVAVTGTTASATAPAIVPSAPRPVGGGSAPGAAPTARPGSAVGPAASVAPSPPAPTAPTAPAPAAKGGVRISPPRIIGDLRQDAFMALAGRARAAVEQCNPDRHAVVVKVDVMIGNRKITIAQPAVNTNPGDPLIARCVAQSLKDAQSAAFSPGESGIYQEAQFAWQ